MQYNDGKKFLWRKGFPRITENMNQYISGFRNSGHYGSGIYAYNNLHVAMKIPITEKNLDPIIEDKIHTYISHDKEKRQNEAIVKLDITDMRLYEPNNLPEFEAFTKKINNIISNHLWLKKERNFDELEQYRQDMNQIIKEAEKLEEKDSNLQGLSNQVSHGIQSTLQCLKTKKSNQCSQPINHMLSSLLYDGILPPPEYANDNRYGAVIFTDSFYKTRCIKYTEKNDIIDKKDRETIDLDLNCDTLMILDNYDIQQILKEEKDDEYLQLMNVVEESHRKDFQNRLDIHNTMSKTKKKNRIEKIYQSCLHWRYPDDSEDIHQQQCQKLKQYYTKKYIPKK